MRLKLQQLSAIEPVSLNDAKNHLRVDHNDDDSLIRDLIRVARERAEMFCGRSFVVKNFVAESFEWADVVRLQPLPVASLTSVHYRNAADEWVIYENYSAENLPAVQLISKPANLASETGYKALMKFTYSSGYVSQTGDLQSVPMPVKHAILLMIRTMYDNREDIVKGQTVHKLPQNSEYLLAAYRTFEFK